MKLVECIWMNVFKSKKKYEDEVESVLSDIPIFQDLNRRELKIIKKILHKREYKKDEVVFKEGELGLGMYILVSGMVHIVCGSEKQLLAELRDGDFFGELALLDDEPRSATAIAKEASVLLGFFKPELLDIITRNPKMGCKILFKLAWVIGERLKKTNEQLKDLKCLKENASI
jgi:CRP-like cAMP-binding protein